MQAAAEGGDARRGYDVAGGHDGPTSTSLGALAFGCKVSMDAKSFQKDILVAVIGRFGALLRALSSYKGPYKLFIFVKC